MQPPQDTSNSSEAPSPVIEPVATPSEKSVAIVEDDTGDEESDKEAADRVEYLSEEEAGEFREFDPSLKDQESWQPPDCMINFLDKHFNRCLEVKERQAILEDFLKPQCDVLRTPKLDSEMREQLSKKGKDPQFGSEKTLYKIQEQLLEVTRPLACLWLDLTKPTNEQIVQLIQRALVLVGSTSHAISVERRKIAWGRINPSLKALATENYENQKDNLFGPGFLEKAAFLMDTDKALAKVVCESPKPRKRPFEDNPNDLRCFCPRAPRLSTAARGSNARPSRIVLRNITGIGSKEQPREDNRKTASITSTTTDRSYNVCRENITLYVQLEANNVRSLDTTGGTRLPHRMEQTAFPSLSSYHLSEIRRGVHAGDGRGTEPASERSSGNSITLPGTVCEQIVLGGKEGQILPPSGEPVTTKLLCEETPLQNGRVRDDQGSAAGRRLDVLTGPKGHIPVSISVQGGQEIPAIYLGQ